MTSGEVFFREWREKSPGEQRSLRRARDLMGGMELGKTDIPIATIAGSKGKGTAATYASAYLAASGLRVVTVTSPSYRNNRERIRSNGRALTTSQLADLAAALDDRMRALPDRSSHGGYLSPVGLFTIAGALHARRIDADVLVLEAGRGGRSDEVSLFTPSIVGMTSIFAEHLGQIGRWIDTIAIDKAESVAVTTRAVVSLPQTPSVQNTVTLAISARTRGRLKPSVVPPLSTGIPVSLLATGSNQANSELGVAVAQRLLDVTTHARPEMGKLKSTLKSLQLPGRSSWHRIPGSVTEILADSAINRAGVAAAMTAAHSRWNSVDRILLCLPDHKDLPGVIPEIGDVPVTFVRLPDGHLRFGQPIPATWHVINAEELTLDMLSSSGRTIALGTVYFIGRILDLIDARTERLFTVPS